MGSLFLLLFIGFILALLVWIVIKVPWWAKPLVIIVAFLAVKGDVYLGRKEFKQICKEQSGLHIYETAENVAGLETKDSLRESPWLTKYNFRYVEKKRGRKIERLTKQADGNILREEVPKMKSKYKIKFSQDLTSNKKFSFTKYQVIRKTDQKIMASYNYIGYKGGWVSRSLAALYASSSKIAVCPKEERQMFFWDANITKVLKPRKEEK